LTALSESGLIAHLTETIITMKKLITLALLLSFISCPVLFASPDKDTLIAAEKKAWQDIKDKKFDDFKKVFAPDFKGVYADGINNVDKEMAGVSQIDLKSFTLGDIEVTMVGKDAALLTYSVTGELSQDGNSASTKMNAASVWKKEGNDWKLAFHTDVEAK
jgi:ketosteroid isomerase-like protein